MRPFIRYIPILLAILLMVQPVAACSYAAPVGIYISNIAISEDPDQSNLVVLIFNHNQRLTKMLYDLNTSTLQEIGADAITAVEGIKPSYETTSYELNYYSSVDDNNTLFVQFELKNNSSTLVSGNYTNPETYSFREPLYWVSETLDLAYIYPDHTYGDHLLIYNITTGQLHATADDRYIENLFRSDNQVNINDELQLVETYSSSAACGLELILFYNTTGMYKLTSVAIWEEFTYDLSASKLFYGTNFIDHENEMNNYTLTVVDLIDKSTKVIELDEEKIRQLVGEYSILSLPWITMLMSLILFTLTKSAFGRGYRNNV